jgi:hypothetical protein
MILYSNYLKKVDMDNHKKSIPYLFLPFILLFTAVPAFTQQNIIAGVDNTHPEFDRLRAEKPIVTQFIVTVGNNCNEIRWAAVQEKEVRKYIVEFTTDGVNYQTAGEMAASNKPYLLKHYFNYEHPILYRIRTEQLNGLLFTSESIPANAYGDTRLVEIYPTIVTGNTLNMNAGAPVEKVNIISGNGVQVYEKSLGGQRDKITFVVPSLQSGMYFVVISGNYWKTTEKIIVQ